MDENTTINRKEKRMGEKLWDVVLKIAVCALFACVGWTWNTNVRVSTLENQVQDIRSDSTLDTVQQDIRTLLDRTARMETKLENIDRGR